MGDVGIVARVLDDAGPRAPVFQGLEGQREGGFAARQGDGDRIGESPVSNAA